MISHKTPPSYSTLVLPLLSPTWNRCKNSPPVVHEWFWTSYTWERTISARLSTVPTRADANRVPPRHICFFSNFNYGLKLTVWQVFPIRIKLLGSKLHISYFLSSQRCFWHLQIKVQLVPLLHLFPVVVLPSTRILKCIHFQTPASVLYAVFCSHETD